MGEDEEKVTKLSENEGYGGPRGDAPKENLEKFKQVLLYILDRVGGKVNVGKTVLFKLLYFIDFDFYELYEAPLMGLCYVKKPHGPVPVAFDRVIKEMAELKEIEEVNSHYFSRDQKKYLALVKPNIDLLSGKEIKHVDWELERHGDKNAREISDLSHSDTPWIIADENAPLDYESVFYREKDTSVRVYEGTDED